MSDVNSMAKNYQVKFDDLYQVLIQESTVYEKLIKLMEQKQRSIIEGNITALQDYTAKEQAIIREANTFSNTRLFILKEILAKLNKNTNNASLTNLLELSGKSKEKHWQNIKQKLNNAIDKIRVLNFENQELLKTSLAFVKEMVKVFFPKDEYANGTYTSKGKVVPENKTQQVLNCHI